MHRLTISPQTVLKAPNNPLLPLSCPSQKEGKEAISSLSPQISTRPPPSAASLWAPNYHLIENKRKPAKNGDKSRLFRTKYHVCWREMEGFEGVCRRPKNHLAPGIRKVLRRRRGCTACFAGLSPALLRFWTKKEEKFRILLLNFSVCVDIFLSGTDKFLRFRIEKRYP